MFELLKNFIFPRKCVGCGEWGAYLCPDCVNFIKTHDQPICPICYNPSVYGLTHPSCFKPRGLNGLTSVFEYKGVVKSVIAKLKYRFVTDLAETILEMFLSFCGEDKAFTKLVREKNTILVPIPLHWSRKNWRGFNQAELLGQIISQKLGIGFIPDLLIRTKNTKTQSKLKKENRQKNILGAFKINQSLITNADVQVEHLRWSLDTFDSSRVIGPRLKHRDHQSPIILFDDVWTTGATMKECAKVLKKKGFKRVWGLTLAR